MCGISKKIDLPIKVVGRNVNPANGKVNLGFTATIVLDRTDFDISYQHKTIPDFIGKDVTVVLNILTRSLEL